MTVFLPISSQRQGSIDGTPIELNGATNTVDTATKNDSTVVIKGDIMGRRVVGSVEVAGVGRELSSKSINLLDPGTDTEAQSAGNERRPRWIQRTRQFACQRNRSLLGLGEDFLLKTKEATDFLELVLAVDNVLELVQEPLVDLGQIVHLLNVSSSREAWPGRQPTIGGQWGFGEFHQDPQSGHPGIR